MLPALLATGLPLAGDILGGIFGNNEAEKQQELYQQALAMIEGVSLPELQSMMINLPEYSSVGEYNPMLDVALQQQMSQLGDYQVDPRLLASQMGALGGLEQRAQTGITPTEMAALRQMQEDVSGDTMSARQDILREMAQRGQSGSGVELATQLQASQSGAQEAGRRSRELAAMVNDRALQSLLGAGDMAGNIRGQGFGEQKDIASAQDVINRFNVANRQNVGTANVASQNAAQMRNLQERQRISEQNVASRQQQEMYNRGLQKTLYDMQMQKAGAATNVMGASADAIDPSRTQKMFSNIGESAGPFAAAGSYYAGKSDGVTPEQERDDVEALIRPKNRKQMGQWYPTEK